MAKASFVQLAHVFDPTKHSIGGWYASEKLDGNRMIWDGGTTRGLLKDEVPFANMVRDVTPNQICTGLWSRYGNVIHAPDWWLDMLPECILDGEAWCGIGNFQDVSSIVRTGRENCNPEDWKKVTYRLFGAPTPDQLMAPRYIDETNFPNKNITEATRQWFLERFKGFAPRAKVPSFYQTMDFLNLRIVQNEVVIVHQQHELPFNEAAALEEAKRIYNTVLTRKGEGLIVRNGATTWIPERVYNMLKIKPAFDAEATVVGYTTGDLTDKGSKLLGKMGAAICELPSGGLFKVSGFTHAERRLSGTKDGVSAEEWAIAHPAQECPSWITNRTFPVGTVITYEYRELTRDNVPKEARYLRKPTTV